MKIPSNAISALSAILILAVVAMLAADLNGRHIQELSLVYPGSDKLLHFVAHLVLTALSYGALRRYWPQLSRRVALGAAIVLSILLGLLDEAQQYFVGGREFDRLDLAANVCGTATCALLLTRFLSAPRRLALLAVLPLGVFSAVYVQAYTGSRLFSEGLLQIRAGDLQGARQSFLEAIARGQGNPALYNELAWLELEYLDADPAGSLRHTEQAVAAEPERPDFLDTHGWALYRNGRFQEALDYLHEALARDPGIYCIHYHLGVVHHALRNVDAARAHLRRQLAVSGTGTFAERSHALLAALDAEPAPQAFP